MTDDPRHDDEELLRDLYAAERSRPPVDEARLARLRASASEAIVQLRGGPPPRRLRAESVVPAVLGFAIGAVFGVLGHAAYRSTDATPSVGSSGSDAGVGSIADAGVWRHQDATTQPPGPTVGGRDSGPTESRAEDAAAPASTGHDDTHGLAAERRLIDAARAALAADRADAAHGSLVAHRRRFPRGALAEERDAIDIEALVQLGRRDDAQAAAERFREDYPRSIHTGTVRRALRHEAAQ